MTEFRESARHPYLQLRLEELLEEAPVLENEVHTSYLAVNLGGITLLNPSFPETVKQSDLAEALVREWQSEGGSSLGKLIVKITNAFESRRSNASQVSFSPSFTSRLRSVRGTPDGGDPWAWLEISETTYEGIITVGDEHFTFDPNSSLFRATSARLNSDGRQIASSVSYTYIPGNEPVASAPLRNTNPMPYLDPSASPFDNMSSIVEAAFDIR